MSCPCGKGSEYESCCRPYVEGKEHPAAPEALMRARYSSYVVEATDYILTSNHPDTASDVDLKATRQWSKKAEWDGLEVLRAPDPGDSEEAEVEFVARYAVEGVKHSHHELARFKKHDGRWYFLDGELVKSRPYVREEPRVGRNDPCPCGSGKKYKKCCAA